ncbi:MAG: CYTH domain-containing protein [Cyclonatronaceae bacterium]
MAQEIERKFLVDGDFKNRANSQARIRQGYLSLLPERTVRVRVMGGKGFLTIKGIADASGVSRYEWEREIPVDEAEKLLSICEPGFIDKTRYFVKQGDYTYEVDEFHGDNKGLVIAEVELQSVDEHFEKPDWLGEEVTGDARYYNSSLIRKPFKKWK